MTLPYDQDTELSTMLLGDVFSPGTVEFQGHDRVPHWDIQRAKGQSGATTKLNGLELPQFQAIFYLASDDVNGADTDFDRWEIFQRLIESTTLGPKPFALPCYHPDLSRNGITEVSNGGVMGPRHDGRGGRIQVVKFIVFNPPKPKPVKRAEAKVRQGTTVIVPPDPNAAARARLEELRAQTRSI